MRISLLPFSEKSRGRLGPPAGFVMARCRRHLPADTFAYAGWPVAQMAKWPKDPV